MNSNFPTRIRRRAFTLLELLIVIGIIAILAAILLPVLGKAKAKVAQTTCLSNLKQLALAAHQYADDDENDFYPLEKPPKSPWHADEMNLWSVVSDRTNNLVWYNALAQDGQLGHDMFYFAATPEHRDEFYERNIYHCPAARTESFVGQSRPFFSIAMNSKLSQKEQPFIKRSSILSQPNTPLFLDAGVDGENPLPGQDPYDGRPHVYAKRFGPRHLGRGNIAFVDGHCESLKASDVVTSEGVAYFPQSRVVWTCDPKADPNK